MAPDSFLGKLRDKTGLTDFDLPTAAQWEYLCRAKTTTVFNDGNADAKYSGTEDNNNGNTNTYLTALGWYKYGYPESPTAQPVGGKLPNAWGLYDTHGNVWEWCRNWASTVPVVGVDPQGPNSSQDQYRMRRGGGHDAIAANCRSGNHSDGARANPYRQLGNIGFRVVRTLQ